MSYNKDLDSNTRTLTHAHTHTHAHKQEVNNFNLNRCEYATCVALCCHQVPSLFPLTKDALEAFLAHMSALLHDADAQVSGLVTVSALASRVLHRTALLPCQGWVTSVLGEPLEAAVAPFAFNRMNILALVRTQGRPRNVHKHLTVQPVSPQALSLVVLDCCECWHSATRESARCRASVPGGALEALPRP